MKFVGEANRGYRGYRYQFKSQCSLPDWFKPHSGYPSLDIDKPNHYYEVNPRTISDVTFLLFIW
jgi:hypothetical protein